MSGKPPRTHKGLAIRNSTAEFLIFTACGRPKSAA